MPVSLAAAMMRLGKLRQVVVRRAARLVVQVMEFADGRITGLQHFHLHEGGNRLDIFGRQRIQEPEHDLAPGPETVSRLRAAPFAHAGHGPLERVAVQVDSAPAAEIPPVCPSATARIALNGQDHCHRNRWSPRRFWPTTRQQRLFRKNRRANETVDMPLFLR